jgi:hypothetical protein
MKGMAIRVADLGPELLGVSLSHLALVCGKCSQNLRFLPLGHLEKSSDRPSSAATSSTSAGEIFSSPAVGYKADPLPGPCWQRRSLVIRFPPERSAPTALLSGLRSLDVEHWLRVVR